MQNVCVRACYVSLSGGERASAFHKSIPAPTSNGFGNGRLLGSLEEMVKSIRFVCQSPRIFVQMSQGIQDELSYI